MEFSHRRRVETRLETGLNAAPADQRVSGLRSRPTRTPRHAGIFEAVHRLDAGLDAATRAELAKWIRDEYASEFGDVPLGLFAQCHLGPPYIDHRLDLWQSILEHFTPADTVPEPFAKARMLVRTGAYEFIEVYASGELTPVLKDGSVVA
jgi:hypothetical protein